MGKLIYSGNKAQGSISIGDFANLADGEIITIGDQVYEWDDDLAVEEGNVLVGIKASGALSVAELLAKINANKPSVPVTAYVDPITTTVCRIKADNKGAAGNLVFTTDMGDGDNVISGSGHLEYGEQARTQKVARGSYVVNAIDAAAGSIQIETGLTTPRFVQVEFLDTDGLKREGVTDLVSIVEDRIQIDADGATHLVDTDVIEWMAWE